MARSRTPLVTGGEEEESGQDHGCPVSLFELGKRLTEEVEVLVKDPDLRGFGGPRPDFTRKGQSSTSNTGTYTSKKDGPCV